MSKNELDITLKSYVIRAKIPETCFTRKVNFMIHLFKYFLYLPETLVSPPEGLRMVYPQNCRWACLSRFSIVLRTRIHSRFPTQETANDCSPSNTRKSTPNRRSGSCLIGAVKMRNDFKRRGPDFSRRNNLLCNSTERTSDKSKPLSADHWEKRVDSERNMLFYRTERQPTYFVPTILFENQHVVIIYTIHYKHPRNDLRNEATNKYLKTELIIAPHPTEYLCLFPT